MEKPTLHISKTRLYWKNNFEISEGNKTTVYKINHFRQFIFYPKCNILVPILIGTQIKKIFFNIHEKKFSPDRDS